MRALLLGVGGKACRIVDRLVGECRRIPEEPGVEGPPIVEIDVVDLDTREGVEAEVSAKGRVSSSEFGEKVRFRLPPGEYRVDVVVRGAPPSHYSTEGARLDVEEDDAYVRAEARLPKTAEKVGARRAAPNQLAAVLIGGLAGLGLGYIRLLGLGIPASVLAKFASAASSLAAAGYWAAARRMRRPTAGEELPDHEVRIGLVTLLSFALGLGVAWALNTLALILAESFDWAAILAGIFYPISPGEESLMVVPAVIGATLGLLVWILTRRRERVELTSAVWTARRRRLYLTLLAAMAARSVR